MSEVMLEGLRQPAKESNRNENVGTAERWCSAAAGASLLAAGTRRGGRLGVLAAIAGGGLIYRAITGHCTVYEQLHLNTARQYGSAAGVRAQRGARFEKVLVINQPPAAIYRFWRDLKNLPRIMEHLESVVENGAVSHWTARGPFGESVEWDAEIIEERPDELVAWRSIPGSQLDTSGSLRLQPLTHDRGTAVRLNLKYDPPGGMPGAMLASWLGADIEDELAEGLRHMKQLLEAGEIPNTEQQPAGSCSRRI